MHRDLRHHEPPAEMTLGIAQDLERVLHARGHLGDPGHRDEDLGAEGDAVRLFDLRREPAQVGAGRLAADHARELGSEGDVRRALRRRLVEDGRERRIEEPRRGAEGCRGALVVLGACLHQRDGAAIAELAEAAHGGDEQLAIEALLLDELLARLREHRARERRVERERAGDAGEALLVGRTTTERGVDLLAEALDDLALEGLGLERRAP